MTAKTNTNRQALLKIATLVRPALASQAYIPALTHIRFADGMATAYNDISAISVRSGVDMERCVPGELLIKTLASFGGEQIMVQGGKDGALLVSSGRSKLTIPTMPQESFPLDDDQIAGEGSEIGLDHSILKGIERCLVSVGNDPTHPAQMGVTLDADSKGLAVLFSTDNFTISRYQTKTKIDLPGDSPVIMPTFFCEQLLSLAKTFPDEPMTLVLLAGGLLVEFGEAAKLFTKTLFDLEPLDFPRIIDKHCKIGSIKTQLSAIPDSFDGALERALLVLGGVVDKATKIDIDGELQMFSTSSMGESNETMPYAGQEAPDEPFWVDPSLLARASKLCAHVAFLPKVVILADSDVNFVHLVAHCSR